MPEGHSLHRLARDLQELVGHEVRASSPQGRFREGAAAVDGCTLEQAEAVGKHLLLGFAGAGTVHVHLGMQAKFLRFSPVTGDPLRQVRLRLHAGDLDVAWDLIAPSTCELLAGDEVATLRSTLGPDPLGPDPDRGRAIANLRGSGTTIGEALLDQSLLAGVGNVFRAEALLRTHVHPRTPASDLSDRELDELWDVLTTIMKQAVDDGEIRPKLVYKQPTCLQCHSGVAVESFDLHGRTAYVCPTCQCQPRTTP